MNVGNVFAVEKNNVTAKVASLLQQGFVEINIVNHPKNPDTYYVTASKMHQVMQETREESDFLH